MKTLTLKRNKNTYEVLPFKDSAWKRVLKNSQPLALVMDQNTAFQVIYSDIGDKKFLHESDFEVTA